jgi:hypothetical protein
MDSQHLDLGLYAFDVIDSHTADDAPAIPIGMDIRTAYHSSVYWKRFVLTNGLGTAAALMNSFTVEDFKSPAAYQLMRSAYTRGMREAKAILSLRAKREAEEAAAQVRERNTERNAERNRKKRAARKRSKQQQA